jgi:L-threonylcarbamoyladenylate synthase
LIRPADSAAIAEAAHLLRAGQLVAMPTETVYGLAADALNAQACAAIFEVKQRPQFDPLIVHVLDLEAVWALCAPGLRGPLEKGAGTLAQAFVPALAKAFWPGALTLVLPKSDAVPDIVTSGLPTFAVRIPSHPVARALLGAVGRPLAAPSANLFGCLSPTTAEHVEEQLGDRVPLILDGGPCEVGVESSIVDLSGEAPRLLRAGGVTQEALEEVLGRPLEMGPSVLERPLAPGQLASHYAPITPLRIYAKGQLPRPPGRAGLLSLQGKPIGAAYSEVEVLSPTGDLREAAANLFAALHRLDAADLDVINVETLPETGLGRAIMDRLRKAEAKA